MHLALGHGPPAQGDTAHGRLPRRIKALHGVRMRSVAAGYEHSCAMTHAGELFTWGCWGSDADQHPGLGESGPLPRKRDLSHYGDSDVFVVGVATGRQHTLVASNDGRVYGFGSDPAMGDQIYDVDVDHHDGGLLLMITTSLCHVASW
jgi:alpha-tubulin suppressor-like RCC1 family protein